MGNQNLSRKKADVTPSAPTRIFSIHPRPPVRGAVWHHVPNCAPPQHGGKSYDVCVTVSRRRVPRRPLHVSLAAPRSRAPAQWPGTKMAAPSGALWTALLLVTAALALAGAVSEPTTVPFDVRPGGVVHSFSQDVGPGVSAELPSGASPTGTAGIGRSQYRFVPEPVGWQGRGYPETGNSKGRGCLRHCLSITFYLHGILPSSNTFWKTGFWVMRAVGLRTLHFIMPVPRGLLMSSDQKGNTPGITRVRPLRSHGCEAGSQPNLGLPNFPVTAVSLVTIS